MSVFFDIESALQTKLNGVSGKPYIQWENDVTYTPAIGTRYWRATNLPAGSILASASGLQQHQGIYQVDAFVPTNKGIATLMNDLDSIYNAFNTTLSLTSGSNRIDIMEISRGRTLVQDGWCQGFIQINYMCFAH